MAPHLATTILSLAAGLSNALNPHVCVCCLASIVPTTALDEPPFVMDLRRNQHHFLNGAVSYVIARGSALRTETFAVDHRAQLQLWVRQCMSRTQATERRQRHQAMLDALAVRHDATHMDVKFLCIILCRCLSVVRRHPSQRFSRQLWPTCAEDVLPTGADDTTLSLCALLETVDAHVVADYAHDVNMTCQLTHQAAFIDATLVAIVSTIACLDRNIDSAHSTGDLYQVIPKDSMQRLDSLVALLFEIAVPFVTSLSKTYVVERMIPTINRALTVAMVPRTLEDLACIGGMLAEAFNPSLALHPRIEEFLRSTRRFQEDPYRSIHQSLITTILRRACAGPGCAVTERDISRSLSVCGRCRIFRYCTQACQKNHWRASHKSACDALCMLFDATGISKFSVAFPAEEFTAACRAARFSEEDISTLARAYGLISADVPMKALHGTAERWEAIWLRQFRAGEDEVASHERQRETHG